MEDDTKKVLTAVGVGVAATSVIATAMYFLGGREAPKLPSFGELTGAAKREIGFGAVATWSDDRTDELAKLILKHHGIASRNREDGGQVVDFRWSEANTDAFADEAQREGFGVYNTSISSALTVYPHAGGPRFRSADAAWGAHHDP